MKELWNQEIRITSTATDDERQRLKKAFERVPPYPPERLERELEPTPEEVAAMRSSQQALKKALGRMELPCYPVPRERIHVLHAEDFREVVTDQRHEAGIRYGHIYLKRKEDRIALLQDLTHEFSHAASYYQLQVLQGADRPKELTLNSRRVGFSFNPWREERTEKRWFEGMNEGATELLASLARNEMLTDEEQRWTPEERKRLEEQLSYREWVAVVNRAINVVADHEQRPVSEVQKEFFEDYLQGTYASFRRLQSARPGSTAALRLLNSSAEDASRALEILE